VCVSFLCCCCKGIEWKKACGKLREKEKKNATKKSFEKYF
jgi:hypothetical protein